MRRLKIGVWLLEKYDPTTGGGFGYYSELIECISKTKFSNADICFLGEHNSTHDKVGQHKYYSVKLRMRNGVLPRLIKLIGTKIFRINPIINYYQNLDKKQYQLLHNICDIIYYPTQFCKYENFPFIYTLWDLGHITTFAFPELSNDDIFEGRKKHFDRIPFKALMVFCESETGKKDTINYLRLNEDRIRVLPLIPSGVIAEKNVPSKPKMVDSDCIFIHYPAQFWAHKNHYNLICAFCLIADKFPTLKLILSGSDYGNKPYITKTIEENNLEDRVIDLGFIPLTELKWLYVHSKGLIMPTLLGPTNMPQLEALALNCPVAISDIPGHREQMGDNAIYFNPLDIEDIKNAIENLINSNYKLKASLLPTIQSNMVLLDKYFAELKLLRHTWA